LQRAGILQRAGFEDPDHRAAGHAEATAVERDAGAEKVGAVSEAGKSKDRGGRPKKTTAGGRFPDHRPSAAGLDFVAKVREYRAERLAGLAREDASDIDSIRELLDDHRRGKSQMTDFEVMGEIMATVRGFAQRHGGFRVENPYDRDPPAPRRVAGRRPSACKSM
jgi:hypothetical protein